MGIGIFISYFEPPYLSWDYYQSSLILKEIDFGDWEMG